MFKHTGPSSFSRVWNIIPCPLPPFRKLYYMMRD